MRTRLSRSAAGLGIRPAAPPRIVHLGAGAFHRAHQAWYTAHAPDAADWGIVSFTGRRTAVADQLAPQDGVFTLVQRGPHRDRLEIIDSIVEVHAAHETQRFTDLLTSPAVGVVTLTVTEAGYHIRGDGSLDTDAADVAADIAALRSNPATTALRTAPARLLAGLLARGGRPLAVIPCDNLPRNGELLQSGIAQLADAARITLALDEVSFVSTSVDRITPHTTADDRAVVAEELGFRDEACVVAEPFADWTLAGVFPAGRPQWDAVGARFVDDLDHYERRKLILLNGGHLVLAFHGLARGAETVSSAMTDARCRRALEEFWTEAQRVVGGGEATAEYIAALRARFENPRIAHRLTQIAVDTVAKVRLRIIPVIEAERAAGRSASASQAAVDAWRDLLAADRIAAEPSEVRDLLNRAAPPGPPDEALVSSGSRPGGSTRTPA